MAKKNVLFITGYSPFRQGGAEYQAFLLAEHLKKQMKISFVFRNHWDKPQKIEDRGYTLYAIEPRHIQGTGGSFIFEGLQLNRILKKISPEIIYIRGANAYTMIAVLYAKKKNCKIVWHIAHDRDVIPLQNKRLFQNPFKYMDKKMVEYGLIHSECIVGQTQCQSTLLKNNYNRPCDFIIGNWHPVPTNIKKDNSIIKILWIANWRSFKQPEIFVNLANELKNISNIQFIMLGRNEQYPQIKKRAIANNIHVMGEISNSKVNELLSESHLLVNTSQMEGFSNTFIQAWMRRVPVISLQVDPDDVLRQNGIGFCSGTFMQLVEDTKFIIKNHKLREIMGKKARQYAIEHHSLKNLYEIMNIFNTM